MQNFDGQTLKPSIFCNMRIVNKDQSLMMELKSAFAVLWLYPWSGVRVPRLCPLSEWGQADRLPAPSGFPRDEDAIVRGDDPALKP
jgi:hypothetical protein